MRTHRSRCGLALIGAAVALTSLACWENNSRNTILELRRFEVATSSVLLGARQLLVDTATGDVWTLEGEPRRWVLMTRGPEDVREVPPRVLELVPDPERKPERGGDAARGRD